MAEKNWFKSALGALGNALNPKEDDWEKATRSWQVNIGKMADSQDYREDWTCITAIMEALSRNSAAVREEIADKHLNKKGGFVEITVCDFMTKPEFVWNFEYHPYRGNADPIPYFDWVEKTVTERERWYPVLTFGYRDNGYELSVTKDSSEYADEDFMKAFCEAFWKMAGSCLGLYLNRDEKLIGTTIPTHAVDELPEVILGVKNNNFRLSVFGNLSVKAFNDVPKEKKAELLLSVKDIRDALNAFLKGVSNEELGAKPTSSGTEKSDYDLLREAFRWAQKHIPNCRPKYAEDGIAMVDGKEASGEAVKDLLPFMEVSGNYDAVIKRYEELKLNPSPKKGKPTKPDNTDIDTDDAVDGTDTDDGSDTGSKVRIKKRYDRIRNSCPNLPKKLPSQWEAEFKAHNHPEFADDRQPGKPLSNLGWDTYSLIDIAEKYEQETGKEPPQYIKATLDAFMRKG